jgi:hypothetical protein
MGKRIYWWFPRWRRFNFLFKITPRFFYPRICFYNSDKRVIDWIGSIFEEITILKSQDKRRDNRHSKDNYAIFIRKMNDVKYALECMLPYLKIKKRQAIETIEYLDWKINKMWKQKSKKDREIEDDYHKSISILNGGSLNELG